MRWSGATDALSGIAGYDTTWSTSPTPPPEPWEETSGTSLGSPALEDGISWYFYLRAFDAAGNRAGSALSYGPLWIDATAPATTLSLQQSGDRINLSWSTVEALSGLVSHDLEYRLGSDGEWTGWLVGTTLTSAVFGPLEPLGLQPGQAVYFRLRGREPWQAISSHLRKMAMDGWCSRRIPTCRCCFRSRRNLNEISR